MGFQICLWSIHVTGWCYNCECISVSGKKYLHRTRTPTHPPPAAPSTYFSCFTSHKTSWRHSPIMLFTQRRSYICDTRFARYNILKLQRPYLPNYLSSIACPKGCQRKQQVTYEESVTLSPNEIQGGNNYPCPKWTWLHSNTFNTTITKIVLSVYEVRYLDWYSKDIDDIDTELKLII